MANGHSSARYSAELLERGYCIIENLVSTELIGALASDFDGHFASTGFSEGIFSGNDTRRFAGLLKRSRHAARFVAHDFILQIADNILGPWCDHFSLNLTQAIELAPGSKAQVPHRDQDMWPCSRLVPPERGIEFLVNVIWPLTPFTRDNGATLVWPGSHRRQAELLIDPAEAIVAEMTPGSALLFLGSTLHAAGPNRTPLPRRGMIISYCLGWLKPYELPWLAYPPEIARRFPKTLANLAGYRVHRPNLGTYEGRCPSLLLHDDPGPARAVDMLLPDQEALINAWCEGRVGAGDFVGLPGAESHKR